jgi:hypothetical protein
MDKHKTILNQMLDLGGLATKNNFYSPHAKTILGALVHTRKAFDELEKLKLIQPLSTITKVRNLSQEQFFAITRLGAKYVDRTQEHVWKGGPKSPYNIMHESMVRDVALSFLRNYPDYIFEIKYNERYSILRPDLVVKMTHKLSLRQHIFLVEVERKKTVDRVVKEKLQKYEKVLANINFKNHNLNAPVKVLIVYSNHDYNCFWRPQEYENNAVKKEIEKLHKQVIHLAWLARNLPDNRYRFLAFNDFCRLHQVIWLTPQGKQIDLLS